MFDTVTIPALLPDTIQPSATIPLAVTDGIHCIRPICPSEIEQIFLAQQHGRNSYADMLHHFAGNGMALYSGTFRKGVHYPPYLYFFVVRVNNLIDCMLLQRDEDVVINLYLASQTNYIYRYSV